MRFSAGGLGKVVKRRAGKHLVLTQKISDLDAVVVAPVLVCQIYLCDRDGVENMALLSQTGLGIAQSFKALPAADVG